MDVVVPLDAATAIVHCSDVSGRNVNAVRSPVIEDETLAAECNALPARFNFKVAPSRPVSDVFAD